METTVDERLIVRSSDPNGIQDVVEIIRCQAVARALREEGRQGNQKQSLSITRSLQEDRPSVLRVELLKANCFLNLVELGLHKVVIRVTVCVVLGKSALIKLSMNSHVL